MTSTTIRDVEGQDLNPYRGNKYYTKEKDETGKPIEKDSLGRLVYREITEEEAAERDNYRHQQVYNYLDGDPNSEVNYLYGEATLISDKARVIKGGSWADRAFWLSPGSRRFKEEDKSDRTLGFRCAMIRTGSSSGNDDTGGNHFKQKTKSPKRKYN
jgi:hypothetical protein